MSSPLEQAAPPSLRRVSREAIAHGPRSGGPPTVVPERFPAALRRPGASFVTLQRDGALRGCTGTLVAAEPLVVGVARNAWRAAYRDPRFPPLAAHELPDLDVSVSLLSELEPLPADTPQELLLRLRPGVDGLVLRDCERISTFLPAVWESLSSPHEFLAALLHKAGLPRDFWSPTLRFERYTVEAAE